jgi:uncharacterized protein (DUF1697 family)
MTSYVLLLRGINVGGHRKILMADLKTKLSKLGLRDTVSYIQSGNLVFNHCAIEHIAKMEHKIANCIEDAFGFDVPVMLIEGETYKTIISENPFSNSNNIKNLHCTFFKSKPEKEDLEQLKSFDFEPDEIAIGSHAVYLNCHGNYRQTKFTNTVVEKKLKTPCTTRNWKTVLKLEELLTQV